MDLLKSDGQRSARRAANPGTGPARARQNRPKSFNGLESPPRRAFFPQNSYERQSSLEGSVLVSGTGSVGVGDGSGSAATGLGASGLLA